MRTWGALAASSLLYVAVVVWTATRLPADNVPLHFDATGAANRFGTRAQALTPSIILGVVVIGIGIGLVLIVRFGQVRVMNIPHKAYWLSEQRQPQLRRMLAADISLMISVTLVFLSLIPLSFVLALESEPPTISGVLPLVPIGIYVLALVGWAVWLAKYRYRPADGPGNP